MSGFSRRQFVMGGLALAGSGLGTGCGLGVLPSDRRPDRIPRIGWLSDGADRDQFDAFRQGLAELGYVEGRTLTVELREPAGQLDRLPELAAELVSLPVDIVVASGTTAVRASMLATSTIPVVMVTSASPVEDGFVASLAHPGGNVTGLTGISRELIGKRLELLKAAVPSVSRVGVLWNPESADRTGEFQVAETAARLVGLELRSLEARDPAGIEAPLARALLERVDALSLLDNPVLANNTVRVGGFALEHRLPMMSGNRRYAVAGGLIAYGVNRVLMARRTATYVDKILRGADPANLPIEQPTTFNFVINLKSAQALGLTIPQSVLVQATEIIQ